MVLLLEVANTELADLTAAHAAMQLTVDTQSAELMRLASHVEELREEDTMNWAELEKSAAQLDAARREVQMLRDQIFEALQLAALKAAAVEALEEQKVVDREQLDAALADSAKATKAADALTAKLPQLESSKSAAWSINVGLLARVATLKGAVTRNEERLAVETAALAACNAALAAQSEALAAANATAEQLARDADDAQKSSALSAATASAAIADTASMAQQLTKANIACEDAEQEVVAMGHKSGELANQVGALQIALSELEQKLRVMERDGEMAGASLALSQASSPQRLSGSAQQGNAGAAAAAAAASAAALALPFSGITPRSSPMECALSLRAAKEAYAMSDDAEFIKRKQLIDIVLDKGEVGALAQALAICMKLNIAPVMYLTRGLNAMERVAAALPHLAGTEKEWATWLSSCSSNDKPTKERIKILRAFFAVGGVEAVAA